MTAGASGGARSTAGSRAGGGEREKEEAEWHAPVAAYLLVRIRTDLSIHCVHAAH